MNFPPRMTQAEYETKQKAVFDEAEIPPELRGALSYQAWEDGHAYGYDEVYGKLRELVSNLQEPIKKLCLRLAGPVNPHTA